MPILSAASCDDSFFIIISLRHYAMIFSTYSIVRRLLALALDPYYS
jgi:hypothetical protein